MTSKYIPERPKDAKYRTLVVLLDGTGDRDDDDATNIVLMNELLYNGKNGPGNDSEQLVHYSTGIGADTTESYAGLLRYAYNKIDQAVATSFRGHIIEAYNWLANRYNDGDKICIFGFSRGSYTARALAGMLNAMGLLQVADLASAQEACRLYEKYDSLPSDAEGKEKRNKAWVALMGEWTAFRTDHDVKKPLVEFLGCWDSVNSVGMVDNIKLAHTATNGIVRTFRHALALDERRAKFKQNMWSKPKPMVADISQAKADSRPFVTTDVQEVWFAGCHCDVGGGSVLNGTRPNLAHIPLRWMVRECFKADTGMIFSAEELAKLGIEPSHLYPAVRPRPEVDATSLGNQAIRAIEPPGWIPWAKSFLPSWTTKTAEKRKLELPNLSEEELDARDALAPLYDQLVLKSALWTTMESWYFKKSVYNAEKDLFETVRVPHNSVGRSIPSPENTHGGKIKVHRTVRMRMRATYENGPERGQSYVPKARVGWGGEFKDKTPFERVADTNVVDWVS